MAESVDAPVRKTGNPGAMPGPAAILKPEKVGRLWMPLRLSLASEV